MSNLDLNGTPDLDSLLGMGRSENSSIRAEPESHPAPREPSRYFWLAVLGLAVVLGLFSIRQHWVPNKWLFGDGSFYMNVARGILENHSLRQESLHPHSWYEQDLGWNTNVDAAWSNIAVGRHGEWWPKHPILMPLCAAPFIWAFGPLGSLVFQFLFYSLMGVFAYRLATRVASRPASLAAACAFAATPWIADRVWGFNNDVFYTVLILAALDAALARKPILAGALLGIGVFAKATNVLYGPPILLIFLLNKDYRGALRLCFVAAIPAIACLGLNWYMFGSPFRTGYDRILVREHGQPAMHSHAADFSFRWAAVRSGVQRVLMGGEGFMGKFPLFFPALIGLGVIALRRWREALVLGWCIAVPILFHATYAWYRLEFNLPQIAMAVAPLAALLPPFAPPSSRLDHGEGGVRWGRLTLLLLVVILIAAGLGGRALFTRPEYFWARLPQASVFLGETPCDYYNNQTERWECSHFDNDWYMTGRPLEHDLRFNGNSEQVVLFHPHPSGKERRLEYHDVPMTGTLRLSYGLADSSKPNAQVHFVVRVDDLPVLEEDVQGRGLRSVEIDTSPFAGKRAKVTFLTTSPNAQGCIFGINGSPRN